MLLADRWSPPRTPARRRRCWSALPYGRQGRLRLPVRPAAGGARAAGRGPERPRDVRLGRPLRRRSTSARTGWRRCAGCGPSRGTAGGVGMIGPSYMGLVQWAVAGPRSTPSRPSVTASQFHGHDLRGRQALARPRRCRGCSCSRRRSDGSRRCWSPTACAGAPRLYHQTADRRRRPRSRAESGAARRVARGARARQPVLERRATTRPRWRTCTAPVQLDRRLVRHLPALADRGLHAPCAGAGRATAARRRAVEPPRARPRRVQPQREGLAWLRAHLLGDRRLLRPAPVRVFVTGAGRWLELADWPPADASGLRLHLDPGVWPSASSAPAPGDDAEPSRYRYDPADPTPVARRPGADGAPPRARQPRARGARRTSSPSRPSRCAEDLEAIGPVERGGLRCARPAPTPTVRPGLRRRRRRGRRGTSATRCMRLTPGAPERGRGRRARGSRSTCGRSPTASAAGHRIRVQVLKRRPSPLRAQRRAPARTPATATELVAADQEIFHDSLRPSAVTLSVWPGT